VQRADPAHLCRGVAPRNDEVEHHVHQLLLPQRLPILRLSCQEHAEEVRTPAMPTAATHTLPSSPSVRRCAGSWPLGRGLLLLLLLPLTCLHDASCKGAHHADVVDQL
jgi:hypothetical protein